MQKGRIHSFETFGTLDGPGIRLVIFMQGCSFRCLYCHNPDTWDTTKGGNEYTVEEVMKIIRRYLPYFNSSGGGITVSGGEPLLQADFVAELFKCCKAEGIHTALDTNGYHLTAAEGLLAYTDLVLLDIKHMDSESHLNLTGSPNMPVLEFARLLNARNIPVWIRYVLVPGLTDDEPGLCQLGEFIRFMSNIDKIEILPFHKMGEFKWASSGHVYTLWDTPEAASGDLERAKRIALLFP